MKNLFIIATILFTLNNFSQNFVAFNDEINTTNVTFDDNVQTVDNLYFAENVSILNKNATSTLKSILNLLLNNTQVNISINSYTDESELNKNLSNRRAIAAKKYLVKNGVSSKRLKINNFGNSKPLAESNSQELERRVEFILE